MDKIICLGKNYSDHIAEMKEAAPDMPLLFLKPSSVFREIKNQEDENNKKPKVGFKFRNRK